MNKLYYGDNLDVLRQHVKDESVDLVYLDPPFKSNQDYNVLFKEKDGTDAASQFKAFEDTWEWNQASAAMYEEIVEAGGRVSTVMQAFRQFLGTNDMLAYLTMMAPRLVELHRVLNPTGSLYLHCDPTASHYLKLLLDAVFGPANFRNEVIWKRTSAHSAAIRWGDVHDTILFYTKGDKYTWNEVLIPHSDEYAARYKKEDAKGKRWADDNLTAPGVRHGDSGAVWRGFDPTAKGVHWKANLKTVEGIVGAANAENLSTTEKLDLLDKHGYIHWPHQRDGGSGFPRFKRYLSEGGRLQDVVSDIPPVNSQAAERLGYPTQKPEPLLERIIKANSNEDDTVLDPFCGCGTAIAVAQRLNRKWVGIDITHLAIGLIKSRLRDAFGDEVSKTYQVIGEPASVPDAQELAHEDPFQFQWWSLGLVGARRIEQKKGADQGIDGRLYFHDEENGKTKQIILSVKSGHVTVRDVRDLRGVIEREKAEIGVLITLEEATKPMRMEAAAAGFYKSPWGNHPRLQILTIAELFDGARIDYPPTPNVTHKRAPRYLPEAATQHELALEHHITLADDGDRDAPPATPGAGIAEKLQRHCTKKSARPRSRK
jgi:DNA modification methylase